MAALALVVDAVVGAAIGFGALRVGLHHDGDRAAAAASASGAIGAAALSARTQISPTNLIKEHHCWTGSGPAHAVIPGHVVIQDRSGRPRYAGKRMVGPALDEIFAGKHLGLVVYAFCR